MDNYYIYTSTGETLGPLHEFEVTDFITSRNFTGEEYVSPKGAEEWYPISEIFPRASFDIFVKRDKNTISDGVRLTDAAISKAISFFTSNIGLEVSLERKLSPLQEKAESLPDENRGCFIIFMLAFLWFLVWLGVCLPARVCFDDTPKRIAGVVLLIVCALLSRFWLKLYGTIGCWVGLIAGTCFSSFNIKIGIFAGIIGALIGRCIDIKKRAKTENEFLKYVDTGDFIMVESLLKGGIPLQDMREAMKRTTSASMYYLIARYYPKTRIAAIFYLLVGKA